MTALLSDFGLESSNCKTTSRPDNSGSVGEKHSTSMSRYNPPIACIKKGRNASPAFQPGFRLQLLVWIVTTVASCGECLYRWYSEADESHLFARSCCTIEMLPKTRGMQF